jgi:hypothetical protein
MLGLVIDAFKPPIWAAFRALKAAAILSFVTFGEAVLGVGQGDALCGCATGRCSGFPGDSGTLSFGRLLCMFSSASSSASMASMESSGRSIDRGRIGLLEADRGVLLCVTCGELNVDVRCTCSGEVTAGS